MTIRECLELLEIRDTPTKIVIKKAFRRAALQHHPDKRGSSAAFQKIKLAYDTLIAKTDDELAWYAKKQSATAESGIYDPFDDPDYEDRDFFEPERLRTADFERSARAKGCHHCDGRGFMTKIMDPSRGYISKEKRWCKCQWV